VYELEQKVQHLRICEIGKCVDLGAGQGPIDDPRGVPGEY
jgi:hypothetical protein